MRVCCEIYTRLIIYYIHIYLMNEVLKLFCFFQGFLPNSPLGLRPCSAQFALVTSVAAVGLLPGGIASSLIPKTCGCKSAECRLCKDVKRYHMKQVAWYFDRLGENGVDIGAILGDSSGDRRGHLVWALVRSILMWTDARTPPPEELWMPTETRCSQSPSANCSVDFSRGF